MSAAFVPDLEQAMALQCGIEITTVTGARHLTGVVDINPTENWVRIKDPQTLGDSSTTKTILISDITSLTLHTDMAI